MPLILAALITACSPPPPEAPTKQTLLFFDQSASNVLNGPTRTMFRDTIAAIVQNSLADSGDVARAFLLHGNTRGKAGRADFANLIPPANTAGKSKMRQATETNRYQAAWTAYRDSVQSNLLGFLDPSSTVPQFAQHTDVLGALEVISEEVARADSGTVTRVYFFSDMHESMRSPRRNFDAHPPRDRVEAEAWADADTAVLLQMNINRNLLANVEVRVLLGNLANRRGSQEVKFYWLRLFENAGIKPDRVRYN